MKSTENQKNNATKSLDRDDLDLALFLKFIFVNKFTIFSFSVLFFVLAFIYSLTLKRIWEGQFQIVLSQEEGEINTINPFIKTLVGGNERLDLYTQVGILESPSVLMPIFNYVKKESSVSGNKNDLIFSDWKGNLNVNLGDRTSILNIAYRDTNKELIIPVLEKISLIYQDYSGTKKKRIQELTNNFLNNQIDFYKVKSANSLKIAQDFAFDQELIFLKDSNFLTDSKDIDQNRSMTILPNIDIEKQRFLASSQIKSIKSQIKKINEISDEFVVPALGSTIPQINSQSLSLKLAELEQQLAKARTVYAEEDITVKQLIKRREYLVEVLKKRALGYLKAQLLLEESKRDAASRPKGVLLKYKELLRNAARDETTLINLENQLRILELEISKSKDPWELITSPTLLEYPVAPSRKKIAFSGLLFGIIVGIIYSYVRKEKSEIMKFLTS